ncbi:MAG: 2OG-Fe(II) oxygenase, partial [Methyloligellaceae bacterium]
LHNKGVASVPGFICKSQCQKLIEGYHSPNRYRKTVDMERYRFGLGEYKYFDYPLPHFIQVLRESIYPYLVPVANRWMSVLSIEKQFPSTFQALQDECHANHQLKPTALILKYGQGGFNTLHQDLYGEIYFPLQAVICLNEPGVDYSGGEFVMTQQVPRAQSKAIVLHPKQGDLMFFTTNFRPIKGTRGYYRASMRHGVSEVIHGTRHTLGIIFHDAVS